MPLANTLKALLRDTKPAWSRFTEDPERSWGQDTRAILEGLRGDDPAMQLLASGGHTNSGQRTQAMIDEVARFRDTSPQEHLVPNLEEAPILSAGDLPIMGHPEWRKQELGPINEMSLQEQRLGDIDEYTQQKYIQTLKNALIVDLLLNQRKRTWHAFPKHYKEKLNQWGGQYHPKEKIMDTWSESDAQVFLHELVHSMDPNLSQARTAESNVNNIPMSDLMDLSGGTAHDTWLNRFLEYSLDMTDDLGQAWNYPTEHAIYMGKVLKEKGFKNKLVEDATGSIGVNEMLAQLGSVPLNKGARDFYFSGEETGTLQQLLLKALLKPVYNNDGIQSRYYKLGWPKIPGTLTNYLRPDMTLEEYLKHRGITEKG